MRSDEGVREILKVDQRSEASLDLSDSSRAQGHHEVNSRPRIRYIRSR
jgi:hypothetical protein